MIAPGPGRVPLTDCRAIGNRFRWQVKQLAFQRKIPIVALKKPAGSIVRRARGASMRRAPSDRPNGAIADDHLRDEAMTPETPCGAQSGDSCPVSTAPQPRAD